MDYENLSLEEIEQQLQAIDQNRADLQKAREQLRQQAKYDLAQQIKDQIAEHGYDLEEIVQLLGTKKRRAASKKAERRYMRYVDPDNPDNAYSRGVIPGWMKQKMQDQGYDPSSKADREAFKANYLRAIED